MVISMMKANQDRLDLMKQQEQHTAEQHQSLLLAQRVPVYQQIISDHNLPDQIREEAHQALMKLLHSE